ncbi:MAG: hypothetical protein PWQ37_61 [Candidatus Petromonas sp.]|nr:hypothetical protein [Candidatus Petromonas sp.]
MFKIGWEGIFVKKTAVSILTSICLLSAPIPALAINHNLNLPIYEKGMEHEDIKTIQKALKRAGLYNYSELTSYYGPITENAVRRFQKKYGLTADGIVGDSTISKMEELGLFTFGNLSMSLYEEGMEHDDIKVIQQALKEAGVYENDFFTTYYGPDTKEAVRVFQRKYGLVVDGIVGESTIKKMQDLGLVTYTPGRQAVMTKAVGNLSLDFYEKGMNHPDVKIIQKALKRVGTFKEDAYTTHYGPATKKAVEGFQKKYGLTVDGVVGSSTIAKMKSLGLITYTVSRRTGNRRFGEYLDWWQNVKKMLKRNETILTIQDFETGLRFKVKVTAGSNHADVEPLTSTDTNIIKKIWGGFSWARRPVLVFLNGRVIAASMSAMPHAGREDKPAGKYVSDRSDGYGYGYNFDFVKNNGMSGHIDLHFRNSTRHKDDREDPKHQSAVKKAAGLK